MTQPSRPPPAPDAVDLNVLRDATGGDRDLMQELAELYLNDSDLQLRALDDAIENKEMDRIRRIAQALIAASEAVGAATAAGIFRELEASAQAGDAASVREAIDRGIGEFARVKQCLADFR